jgi:hypothetical protein
MPNAAEFLGDPGRAPLDDFASVTGCDRSYGKQGRDACRNRRPWVIQACGSFINLGKPRQTSTNTPCPIFGLSKRRPMRFWRWTAALELTPSVKDWRFE